MSLSGISNFFTLDKIIPIAVGIFTYYVLKKAPSPLPKIKPLHCSPLMRPAFEGNLTKIKKILSTCKSRKEKTAMLNMPHLTADVLPCYTALAQNELDTFWYLIKEGSNYNHISKPYGKSILSLAARHYEESETLPQFRLQYKKIMMFLLENNRDTPDYIKNTLAAFPDCIPLVEKIAQESEPPIYIQWLESISVLLPTFQAYVETQNTLEQAHEATSEINDIDLIEPTTQTFKIS